MQRRHQLGLWLLLILAGANFARAERAANWRVFKAQDGLAESFTTAITISPRTNVWLQHSAESKAVSRLNGYRAYTMPASESSFRIYESRAGQLWTTFPDGLMELREGGWVSYPLREIHQEFLSSVSRRARSISLLPLKQGHVLFLLSDRLMEFNNEWAVQPATAVWLLAEDTALGHFSDMSSKRDGTVWIAGEKGLLRSSFSGRSSLNRTNWEEFLPPPELRVHDFQVPVPDDENGVVVVAESDLENRRVALHFDGKAWRILPKARENFRQAWRTADGTFWGFSINTLYAMDPGDETFTPQENITAASIFDLATEGNGVFWLATSDGVFRHTPALWQTPPDLRTDTSPILGITEDTEGHLWVLTPNTLYRQTDEIWHALPLSAPLARQAGGDNDLFLLRSGLLVASTEKELLVIDPTTKNIRFFPGEGDGVKTKVLGPGKDGLLLLQKEDRLTNRTYFRFDGENFTALSTNILPPLATRADVHKFFALPSGDVWWSTEHGLHWNHDRNWIDFKSGADSPEGLISFLIEGQEKDTVWFGGRDRIWQHDGKDWTTVQYGFDRLNSLLRTKAGAFWAASSIGIHRLHNGRWINYGVDDGLPVPSVSCLYEDRRGRIWAGTSRGLVVYHPDADLDPPATLINERKTSADGTISITYSGRDKWKVSAANELFYSHRLDDQEWSPYQPEQTMAYPDLSAGKHYFQVRAMDRNGNVNVQLGSMDFEVPRPWYQETRLLLILVASGLAVLFFAGLAVNRHFQLVRSYAEVEKLVAIRTRQVEEANAQLLHGQKMNALGTLAAGVAHDFNNILSIIKGSAQIIETSLDDEEKVYTRLDRIKTVVNQGEGIVKAMLGFSRPSDKVSAPCNLNLVATETIRLLGDRFLREVEVRLTAAGQLPEVTAPRDFIQQILLNFIFNAADALNGKGQVMLRTGVWSAGPVPAVLAPAKAEAYVFVAVEDHGSGIAPEVMPRIFEPFFTTKAFSSRRGTGLGLSMAYQMAQQMGAGLAVQSEVGKGSTFTLILPVAKIPS